MDGLYYYLLRFTVFKHHRFRQEDLEISQLEKGHFPTIPFSKVNLEFFAESLVHQGVIILFNKRLFKKFYPRIKVSREICRFETNADRFVKYTTTPFLKVNLLKLFFSLLPHSSDFFLIIRLFKSYYVRIQKRTTSFSIMAVLSFFKLSP